MRVGLNVFKPLQRSGLQETAVAFISHPQQGRRASARAFDALKRLESPPRAQIKNQVSGNQKGNCGADALRIAEKLIGVSPWHENTEKSACGQGTIRAPQGKWLKPKELLQITREMSKRGARDLTRSDGNTLKFWGIQDYLARKFQDQETKDKIQKGNFTMTNVYIIGDQDQTIAKIQELFTPLGLTLKKTLETKMDYTSLGDSEYQYPGRLMHLLFLTPKKSDIQEVIAKLSSKSHINYVPL
jgi:hypothetical protein